MSGEGGVEGGRLRFTKNLLNAINLSVLVLHIFIHIHSKSSKNFLCVLASLAFRQSSQWMLITVKFSFSNSLRLNFVRPDEKS